MSRPPLKKQVAVPLVLAALFGLAWYLLWRFTPELPPGASKQQEMTRAANEWAVTVAQIAFWMSLALVAVRALNELTFFVFRKRKGYDSCATSSRSSST